jgi:hypothetical protein
MSYGIYYVDDYSGTDYQKSRPQLMQRILREEDVLFFQIELIR